MATKHLLKPAAVVVIIVVLALIWMTQCSKREMETAKPVNPTPQETQSASLPPHLRDKLEAYQRSNASSRANQDSEFEFPSFAKQEDVSEKEKALGPPTL